MKDGGKSPRGQGGLERSREADLPLVSAVVLRWFAWYSRRYMRRHFHAIRVALGDRPTVPTNTPVVVYLNHASWWDPLTMLLLTQLHVPGKTFYAPIDAAALARYGILRRIGLFGVEQGTPRGARQFLERSSAALALPNGGLCVTPQGRFADVRESTLNFAAGLGHLVSRVPNAVFVPLAIEYTFWEERLPEVLAKFGAPMTLDGTLRPQEATAKLETALSETMKDLKVLSIERRAAAFENILVGNAGVGGFYDGWRRVRSWMRGERFTPEHSATA